MKWLIHTSAKENEYLVFCYATVQEKKIRKQIWETDPETERYELPGYKEVDLGDGYHDLVKSEGSVAKGLLFRLSKEELDALDEWEEKYLRTKVGEEENKPVYAYLYKAV